MLHYRKMGKLYKKTFLIVIICSQDLHKYTLEYEHFNSKDCLFLTDYWTIHLVAVAAVMLVNSGYLASCGDVTIEAHAAHQRDVTRIG